MPAAYLRWTNRYENENGNKLNDGSIVEVSVGVVCSCVPSCSVLLRHHLPLFVTIKSYMVSIVRIFTAQFSTGGRSSGGSSGWHFFSVGGSKKSADGQHHELEMGSGEKSGMRKLPEMPKGIHKMLTARSFILGSRKDKTTVDEAEDSMYFARRYSWASRRQDARVMLWPWEVSKFVK